jgi:hypothetical protein
VVDNLPVTVRFLEALIRMTQAHAAVLGREACVLEDAAIAVLMMEQGAHGLKIRLRPDSDDEDGNAASPYMGEVPSVLRNRASQQDTLFAWNQGATNALPAQQAGASASASLEAAERSIKFASSNLDRVFLDDTPAGVEAQRRVLQRLVDAVMRLPDAGAASGDDGGARVHFAAPPTSTSPSIRRNRPNTSESYGAYGDSEPLARRGPRSEDAYRSGLDSVAPAPAPATTPSSSTAAEAPFSWNSFLQQQQQLQQQQHHRQPPRAEPPQSVFSTAQPAAARVEMDRAAMSAYQDTPTRSVASYAATSDFAPQPAATTAQDTDAAERYITQLSMSMRKSTHGTPPVVLSRTSDEQLSQPPLAPQFSPPQILSAESPARADHQQDYWQHPEGHLQNEDELVLSAHDGLYALDEQPRRAPPLVPATPVAAAPQQPLGNPWEAQTTFAQGLNGTQAAADGVDAARSVPAYLPNTRTVAQENMYHDSYGGTQDSATGLASLPPGARPVAPPTTPTPAFNAQPMRKIGLRRGAAAAVNEPAAATAELPVGIAGRKKFTAPRQAAAQAAEFDDAAPSERPFFGNPALPPLATPAPPAPSWPQASSAAPWSAPQPVSSDAGRAAAHSTPSSWLPVANPVRPPAPPTGDWAELEIDEDTADVAGFLASRPPPPPSTGPPPKAAGAGGAPGNGFSFLSNLAYGR